MKWHKVAKVGDIDGGKAQVFEIDGQQIALFRQGEFFYAVENRCGHKGGPLAEGSLTGMVVTCPWHAWSFDITTGQCQNVPGIKQKVFLVKIDGSDISVEV